MRRIGIAAVLMFAMTPAAFAVDELKTVASVAELQALPAVQAAGGWDVRLGHSYGGENAGPWILIYCDARHLRKEIAAAPAGSQSSGQPLGPLSVKVSWGELKRLEQLSRMDNRTINDGIYCVSVPITGGGVCHLDVTDAAEVAVAHKDLDLRAKEVAPLYWHQFAVLYDFGKGKAKAWSAGAGAMPLYSGWQPIWIADAAKANDASFNALLKKELPGMIPSDEQWFTGKPAAPQQAGETFHPLQLALEGEKFSIKAGGRQLTDMPDDLLLARWWVNGKAVLAQERDQLAKQQGRLVREVDQMDVLFGYPDSLGKVREGDKIAVQLLCSPGGFEGAGDHLMLTQRMPEHDATSMPMWSNKVEFVLTKELIAAREKMMDKP